MRGFEKIFYKISQTESSDCPIFAPFVGSGGGKEQKMERKFFYAGIGGACTGLANGLFGGGGGMIAVPYLERVAHYKTASAHATAIAVVLPATITSAVVYLWFSLVPLLVLLPVSIGVALGGLLGARLLNTLPPKCTALAFSALMLIAGVRMIL